MTVIGDHPNCRSILLSDAPSDTDEFGTHQRLAELLAATLGADLGGKALALVGAYGSGKSTVVRLLSTILDTRGPDSAVMVYDSWSHSADPLRRSFLEELVRFLAAKKWLREGEAKEELDALSQRTEHATVTSEPTLTLGGRLVAIASLLVPLGYVLWASTLSTQSKLPQSFWGIPILGWGALVVALPVLIAFLVYLWWRPYRSVRPWRGGFWREHRGTQSPESVTALFLSRSSERTSSTTWRTPDPTTLEFQAAYRRILQRALGGGSRRLVLVIDNLDRLPADRAQQTWVTMTTFIDAVSGERGWPEHLWLLVPLASASLPALWPQGRGEGPVMEKTFQAVLPVPTPVLSDWRRFLLSCLSEAFPEHSPTSDFEAIYRLYRLPRTIAEAAPNPREIKLFVNRLVLLHRQWQHAIPLSTMALYLLRERDPGITPENLIRPEFVTDAERAIVNDDNWARCLAAMHFNVALDDALEVLINGPLVRALTGGDFDSLVQLSETHGFSDVCQGLVDERVLSWVSEDRGLALLRAAHGLVRLSETIDVSGPIARVLPELGSVTYWPLDLATAEAMVAISAHAMGEARRDLFRSFLARSLPPETTAGADELATLEPWARGYFRLLSVAPTVLDGASRPAIGVPGNAGQYLGFVVTMSGEAVDDTLLPWLTPLQASANDIAQALAERAASQWTPGYLNALRILLRVPVAWDWQPFIAACVARLSDLGSPAPVEWSVLASLVTFAVRDQASASDALAQLSTSGAILHQLAVAQAASDTAAVALCCLVLTAFLPTAQPASFVGQAASGQAIYRQALTVPESILASLGTLLHDPLSDSFLGRLLDARTTAPVTDGLVTAWLREVLVAEGSRVPAADFVARRHSDLRACLGGEGFIALLRRLSVEEAGAAILATGAFAPDQVELYRDALSAYDVIPADLKVLIASGLDSLSVDEWEAEFGPSSALLDLALRMSTVPDGFRAGQPLQDALLRVGREILGGQDRVAPGCGWEVVFGLLAPDARVTLMRDLRDDLITHTDGPIEKLLEFAGSALLESGILGEKADDLIRRVGTALVERSSRDASGWFERLLTNDASILQGAEVASRRSLLSRAEAQVDQGDRDEPSTAAIQRLVTLLSGSLPVDGSDAA